MPVSINPEQAGLRTVAELMCIAARTAPKARGADNIVTAVIEDEAERAVIAERMREIGERVDAPFFSRDADNIMAAGTLVVIGTKLERLGIPGCNLCGYDGCAECEKAGARCSYNAGDLGIAIGSAVSVAAAHHVDNRVMYSVGRAVVELETLGADVGIAHGIPLSVAGKNIFFDRK